jgi:hypothetical protein
LLNACYLPAAQTWTLATLATSGTGGSSPIDRRISLGGSWTTFIPYLSLPSEDSGTIAYTLSSGGFMRRPCNL